jgi:ribulose-5-phosphate 4-epimerase/fuculose-1-phosphate aldolase
LATSLNTRYDGQRTAAPAPRIYTVERDGDGPRAAAPRGHASVDDERLHRKQQLAASLRLLARYGVDPGLAGHLSARDPEHLDHFWVNPVGVPFSQLSVSDLLRVDSAGKVVEGEGPVNVSVVGIVHAHSFHAKTWSAFGEPIEPIIADLATFHDDQVVFVPDRPPGQSEPEARDEVARQFVNALGDRNVLLWRNHGHWTVGDSVEAAAWRFIAYEQAARVALAARAAGKPIVDAPSRAPSHDQREAWAWLSFLPYWDLVLHDEPDFLE